MLDRLHRNRTGVARRPAPPGPPAPLAGRTLPGLAHARSIWDYRELLQSLILRNLRIKYQRSVLGFLWTMANPVLIVAILMVVFSHIVRLQIEAYWAFLLSGYFVWHFAMQAINAGPFVLYEHADLVRAVAFPTEVLIFGAAIARLFELLVALLPVVVIVAAFHHGALPASFLLLPFLILLLFLLVVGCALPIATVSAFYYDVRHALPIALMALLYISPVFYPASLVPEPLETIYFLNPFAGLLTLFHITVYQGEFPPVAFLLTMAAVAAAFFVIGYAVFNRYRLLFPEVI